MSLKKHRRVALLAQAAVGGLSAAGMLAGPSVAYADRTWSNGTGDGIWQTSSNWGFAGGPPSSGEPVFFPAPGPASHDVTISAAPAANANAGAIRFDADYTIHGPGTLNTPGAPINVTGLSTVTINAPIGSSSGLTKTGTGTLVLGGDNSTSLAPNTELRINAGTVRVSSDANLGATFNRIYTFGTLEVDGTFSTQKRFEPSNGVIRITAGNTLTLSGGDQLGFSNSDTWTKDGPGTLRMVNQTSRFGATTLAAGTTIMNGDFGYGPIIIGNATLEYQPTFSGSFVKANAVSVGVGSIFRAIGVNLTANNVVGASGDITPTFATGTSPTDLFNVNLNSTFGGTVSSTINIAGAGTVRTFHASNYPGAWNVTSGTLKASGSSALGFAPGTLGAVSVANGATLLLDNHATGRTINLAAGAALRGSGGANSGATGIVNVPAGGVTFGAVNATDVLKIYNTDKLTGPAGANITINGPGIVDIAASQATYAGGWTVPTGVLRVNGNGRLGSNPSPVVLNGGTLMVYDIVAGQVLMSHDVAFSGGKLSGSGSVGGESVVGGTINVASGATVTLGSESTGSLIVGDSPNDLTGGGPGTVVRVDGSATLAQPSNIVASWIIDKPTLTISDDAQLGAASNTLTLDGGTLRMGGSMSSPRKLLIAQTTVGPVGVLNTNGFDAAFGEITGVGSFSKGGEGTLTVPRIRPAGSAAIYPGASAGVLKIARDGTDAATSRVESLAISGTGQIDLTNNALVVANDSMGGSWNGTQYTGMLGYVAAGYNGGTWDGTPGFITSETAAIAPNVLMTLAAMKAGEIGLGAGGTFRGVTAEDGDMIIAFTYGGDANLDGTLDGDDYFQIDSNVAQNGSVFGYHNGDFNYDGAINGDDYFIIDSNINAQGPPLRGVADQVHAVPEPAAASVLAMTLTSLLRRRRRR